MHICGARLYRAVHEEIAHALSGEKQIFHNISVVHSASSLNKTVKLSKQLLIAVYKLLYLLLESGVCKLVDSLIALGHQKLSVTECVFDIEQFFWRHVFPSDNIKLKAQ